MCAWSERKPRSAWSAMTGPGAPAEVVEAGQGQQWVRSPSALARRAAKYRVRAIAFGRVAGSRWCLKKASEAWPANQKLIKVCRRDLS